MSAEVGIKSFYSLLTDTIWIIAFLYQQGIDPVSINVPFFNLKSSYILRQKMLDFA